MNTAAITLEYQSIYARKESDVVPWTMFLISVCALISVLAFKVWIKTECTKYGYELASEMQQTVQLDMVRRDLELQHSILLRPDNLVRKAQAELGLAPLNPEQARRIRF